MVVVANAAIGCSAPVASAPAPAPAVSAPVQTAGGGGVAKVDGAVQRISVDLSTGAYEPSVITAKAGVPLEITFGQGSGCLASVLVPDFGIDQDLTQGGAVVKLPAMKAGEHQFSCGMQMVFGSIVVK
jgi:plastocyanin domain-containing protein